MKKIVTVTAFSLLAVALAGLFLYRLSHRETAAKVRRPVTPLVKVSTPQRSQVTSALEFTGDVRAIRQAAVFSKVGGTLEKALVEMGTSVRQGQILAVIDTTELSLQFQQASATWHNARMAFDRTRELYERNLGSQQERDNAEAALRVAQANRDLAATRLSYARITAPFAGVITRRFLDPGALVQAGSTTLFTLMDLSQVKLIVPVLEKDLSRVQAGQTAVVKVDAFPEREFNGKITRFSEAVDPETRTMAAEVDVPNPERLLKPGMFAAVRLIVEQRDQALTLPRPAVLRDDRGRYVYVVRQDTARQVRVETGAEQESRVEILSGLPDTTVQIITTGQQYVKPGSPVIVQP
jgi:membrane fusion protein (multidrug efflux system)